jgi:hypothetical protein
MLSSLTASDPDRAAATDHLIQPLGAPLTTALFQPLRGCPPLHEGKPHANPLDWRYPRNRQALADRTHGHTHCAHRQAADSYKRVSARCRNGVVLHGTVFDCRDVYVTAASRQSKRDNSRARGSRSSSRCKNRDCAQKDSGGTVSLARPMLCSGPSVTLEEVSTSRPTRMMVSPFSWISNSGARIATVCVPNSARA